MAEDDLVLGIGCRRALGLLALSEGDGDEALRWLVDIPAMIEQLAIGEPWAFCTKQDLGEALVLTATSLAPAPFKSGSKRRAGGSAAGRRSAAHCACAD